MAWGHPMYVVRQPDLEQFASPGWRAVLVLACCTAVVCPAEAAGDRWSASLAVTSDYVDKGLSQTHGDPAVQGGIAWAGHPTWYAALWASSVDNGWPGYGIDGAEAEIDLIAGYRRPIDPRFSVDAQLVHYAYFGGDAPVDQDYTELALTLDFRGLLRFSLAYAPDYAAFGHYAVASSGSAYAAELAAQWPIGRHATVATGIGYRNLDAIYDADYVYGSVGVALAIGPLNLVLAQHFTDPAARELFGDDVAGARSSATLFWQFGDR